MIFMHCRTWHSHLLATQCAYHSPSHWPITSCARVLQVRTKSCGVKKVSAGLHLPYNPRMAGKEQWKIMSELSSTYNEYENMSSLFRQLNNAMLVARRVHLGLSPPPLETQSSVRDQLDSALKKLSESLEIQPSGQIRDEPSLEDVLQHIQGGDREDMTRAFTDIRKRIQGGLKALTENDLELIDAVTAALDQASEVLFRRMQRR
jgi:hypothetical protein